MDTGIAPAERAKISEELSRLLADTYILYLKTHGFHWNVTGPMFQTLHIMFETQYSELWPAVDLIAERIRALGEYAPGSYSEMAKLASIKEATDVPEAKEMIRELLEGNEAAARTARGVITQAEGPDDQPTIELATGRLQWHEKTAWMLRSMLES